MSMSNDELDNYMNEHINKLDIKMKEMLNNKIYNIYYYKKIYEDCSEEWYNKFINMRIRGKKIEGYNPGLTENSILFLQTEENFINYFKEFLKLKIKTDYYVKIENEIVNNSREKTDDGSLGLPKIDSNLRKENSKYTISLGKSCDNMYILIEEYLNFIENMNDKFSFKEFMELKTY